MVPNDTCSVYIRPKSAKRTRAQHEMHRKFELVNNYKFEMYKHFNAALAHSNEYHEVFVAEYGKFRVSEEPSSSAQETRPTREGHQKKPRQENLVMKVR